MQTRRLVFGLALACGATSLGSCKKEAERPPPLEGAPVATGAAPVAQARSVPAALGTSAPAARGAALDSAPLPAPDAPAGAGPAYLVVYGRGIVRIEAAQATDAAALPKIRSMARSKDGTIYASGFDGVRKLFARADARPPRMIGTWRDVGSLDHLAVGADGHVWGASFKGVHEWNGSAWSTYTKDQLGAGVTLLRDIAVDGKGRVWVASANAVHVREAGTWRTPALAVSRKPIFVSKIAVDGDHVYALHSSGVLKLEGDTFQELPVGRESFLSTFHLAVAQGVLHVWTTKGLYRVAPGKGTQLVTQKKAGFRGKSVNAIAADAAGRTWLSTDHGLVVIDSAGKATQYAPGTLAAVTGEVKQISVVAGGPALPPVGEQAKGGVTGKLIRDGSPVVGVDVELCASPSMFFRGTPCGDAAFRGRSTTGQDGVFRFDGVPLGQYRFAIKKPGGKWSITSSPCCQGMRKGQSYDVGSLTLSN